MKRKTTEEFIEEAKKIHGDKYDYSKVNYVNNNTKVIITCPIHGDFLMTPSNHLCLRGCPMCASEIRNEVLKREAEKQKSNTEEFIEKAKEIHKDKYDYSKVNYVNNNTKVIITCPIHGDFLVTPSHHLSHREGCPVCKSSKLEIFIRGVLLNNNIRFEEQKKWEWLRYNKPQSVDFYLPEYNIAIECQGIQHFEDISAFKTGLNVVKDRDKNKLDLCTEHGITILYYSNLSTSTKKYDYPYKVYEDIDELLKEINKHYSA